MDARERVTLDPKILAGKPVIKRRMYEELVRAVYERLATLHANGVPSVDDLEAFAVLARQPLWSIGRWVPRSTAPKIPGRAARFRYFSQSDSRNLNTFRLKT